MKDDMVIGAISGYNYEDIEPFVESLERSGYDGHKALLVYVGSKELIDKLEDKGWILFGHQKDEEGGVTYQNKDTFNICVDRFYHYWAFLKDQKDLRYVLSCDVKDVIFQRNPFDEETGLPSILRSHILCSGEGLKYKDEEWGWNNINLSFGPQISEEMADREIVNAGVIAGWHHSMMDLFLHTFLVSRGAPYHVPGGGGPDQAAYNLVSRLFQRQDALEEDAWACQAGTTADPRKIENFRPKLLDPEPVWDGEKVLNSKGEPYTIVHQYDRVPEWKEVLDHGYRSPSKV